MSDNETIPPNETIEPALVETTSPPVQPAAPVPTPPPRRPRAKRHNPFAGIPLYDALRLCGKTLALIGIVFTLVSFALGFWLKPAAPLGVVLLHDITAVPDADFNLLQKYAADYLPRLIGKPLVYGTFNRNVLWSEHPTRKSAEGPRLLTQENLATTQAEIRAAAKFWTDPGSNIQGIAVEGANKALALTGKNGGTVIFLTDGIQDKFRIRDFTDPEKKVLTSTRLFFIGVRGREPALEKIKAVGGEVHIYSPMQIEAGIRSALGMPPLWVDYAPVASGALAMLGVLVYIGGHILHRLANRPEPETELEPEPEPEPEPVIVPQAPIRRPVASVYVALKAGEAVFPVGPVKIGTQVVFGTDEQCHVRIPRGIGIPQFCLTIEPKNPGSAYVINIMGGTSIPTVDGQGLAEDMPVLVAKDRTIRLTPRDFLTLQISEAPIKRVAPVVAVESPLTPEPVTSGSRPLATTARPTVRPIPPPPSQKRGRSSPPPPPSLRQG